MDFRAIPLLDCRCQSNPVMADDIVQVVSWYDNEWGYSAES